ncbi:MAG: hypothetical protein ACR2PX_01190 [Endozoicomonas sp.]|uniref:hypothetical protein n=1 Tax=Endozoicomonas sp. TaxID=1892382 RepID=UPI003D9B8109
MVTFPSLFPSLFSSFFFYFKGINKYKERGDKNGSVEKMAVSVEKKPVSVDSEKSGIEIKQAVSIRAPRIDGFSAVRP